MDRAMYQTAAVQEITDNTRDDRLNELNELELALVGGGSGDPILY
jgi:hypothetical protein